MEHPLTNPLEATALDIQQRLQQGSLTSAELVKECLDNVAKYDRQGPTLRALISVAPRAKLLQVASDLDDERRGGRTRGPFHGIPIVIKDIINADPYFELPTTQGSAALLGAETSGDSLLVKKLRAAGLIILGKGNLSEFGACKGEHNNIGGLSYVGGQSRSAYVFENVQPGDEPFAHSNPGGSSTGSALAVAAGYAPVSIGGEADGSITTPASRSALYALKCTPQSISPDGIFLIVPTFESIGGMAKSVRDLALLTNVILEAAIEPRQLVLPPKRQTWKGLRLGFVEPEKWKLPPGLFTSDPEYLLQIKTAYEGAIKAIRALEGKAEYPVAIPHPSEIAIRGEDAKVKIILSEMRESTNRYLGSLTKTSVRTLEDIITFNAKHPELQVGIDQTYLIQAQQDTTSPEELNMAKAEILKLAQEEGVVKVMDALNLHVIAAPTDGPISTIAALAGLPSACVPLGYHEPSGRPFGLSFLARPYAEDTLLEVMSAFEATFPKRRLPPLLLEPRH